MSMYANDSRLQWASEGSPQAVPCVILDPTDSDGHRIVQEVRGGYVVRGAFSDGYNADPLALTDPGDRYNQRLWVFDSVDEAIAAVIGDPE